MTRTRRPGLAPVALLTLLTVVAAACGGSSSDGGSDSTSGSITVSGSSTVEPITSLVGEVYNEDHPDVSIRVDGPGTGDGFQLFCDGETDISDASRQIKDAEATTCESNGIPYQELKIGIDGLSVITSIENDAVSCLSFEQLYGLVGPESEGISNWSEANDLVSEIGGQGDLPDAPLSITAPGEESGTYDSFIEIALEDIEKARAEEGAISDDQVGTTRKDYSSQSNDNAIIDGIAGDTTSFGWIGFAFADENRDRVKLLEVDGGDGCVAPTPETIADGTYPLARPLFIYPNLDKVAANPVVGDFVDFYLSDEGYDLVAEADYVQLPAEQWDETRAAWEDARP